MKLIIDISEDVYTRLFDNGIQDNEIAVDDICEMARALRLGTPLDSNSEKAEVQAYFDGEAFGWEQGRKALIDDITAEIEKLNPVDYGSIFSYESHNGARDMKRDILDIFDRIGKAESEE